MMNLKDIIRKETQERAYDIFEYRRENNIPGCALGDWLQAEREVLNWHNPNKGELNG